MTARSGGAARKATPPAVAPKPKRSVVSLGGKSQQSTSASSSLNNLSTASASRESLEHYPSPLQSSSSQVVLAAESGAALLKTGEGERAQSLPVNNSASNKNVILMPRTDMFYAPSHPMYSSDGLVALSAENLNKGQQQQQEQNRKASTKTRSSNQQLEQIGSRHMMMTSSSQQTAHKRHSASVRSLPESVRQNRDQQQQQQPASVTRRERSNNEQPSYPRVNSSTHTTNFGGDAAGIGSAATWDISLTKHKPITRHKSTMV